MNTNPILYERNGAVAKLTLNRPEAGNSIDMTLARALLEASIATWLLPRLIGLRHAPELALRNRSLTAAEAAEIGVVTRAVDDASLASEAMAVAVRLAAASTAALGRTRNLLLSSFSTSLEEQLEMEARAIASACRGADRREGLSAFFQKREPDFLGESEPKSSPN